MKSHRHINRIIPLLMLIVAIGACGTPVGAITGAGSAPNTLDGGDGFTTTGGGTLAVGGSQSATLGSLTEAHNWVFQGAAGQTVTIRVTGHPSSPLLGMGDIFDRANWSWQGGPVYSPPSRNVTTDPRVKLIDTSNTVLGEDDDSGGGVGGWDSLLTATLPADGPYTLRVDVFSPGGYTIEVQ